MYFFFFSFFTETSLVVIGESGHQSSCKEFNEDTDQTNDEFSLGFINGDPNENFVDDGNMDDYSSSPSFEVFEEIKVNHGLFVSTRQVAETFFHQLVPSQTVQVHLNPVLLLGNNFLVEKSSHSNSQTKSNTSTEDFLNSTKLIAFAKAKLVETTKALKLAWWTIVSAIICTISLVLTSQEHKESEKMMDIFASSSAGVEGSYENGCSDIFKERKRIIGMKLCNEKGKVSVVNISGGNNITVFLKKIGIFLTISLALCTMWANHNMAITIT